MKSILYYLILIFSAVLIIDVFGQALEDQTTDSTNTYPIVDDSQTETTEYCNPGCTNSCKVYHTDCMNNCHNSCQQNDNCNTCSLQCQQYSCSSVRCQQYSNSCCKQRKCTKKVAPVYPKQPKSTEEKNSSLNVSSSNDNNVNNNVTADTTIDISNVLNITNEIHIPVQVNNTISNNVSVNIATQSYPQPQYPMPMPIPNPPINYTYPNITVQFPNITFPNIVFPNITFPNFTYPNISYPNIPTQPYIIPQPYPYIIPQPYRPYVVPRPYPYIVPLPYSNIIPQAFPNLIPHHAQPSPYTCLGLLPKVCQHQSANYGCHQNMFHFNADMCQSNPIVQFHTIPAFVQPQIVKQYVPVPIVNQIRTPVLVPVPVRVPIVIDRPVLIPYTRTIKEPIYVNNYVPIYRDRYVTPQVNVKPMCYMSYYNGGSIDVCNQIPTNYNSQQLIVDNNFWNSNWALSKLCSVNNVQQLVCNNMQMESCTGCFYCNGMSGLEQCIDTPQCTSTCKASLNNVPNSAFKDMNCKWRSDGKLQCLREATNPRS